MESGVLVSSVEDGGAAAKAGLKPGDVIVKVDDKAVTSMKELNGIKKNYKAGDTATLTVNRGGAEVQLSICFDAAPEQKQTATQPQQNQNSGNSNGGIYYDPWDLFNDFFGNGFGGSYYGNNGNSSANDAT